jgi:hypothetical protein
MNAFDWLMNMPLAAVADECKVIEVSFNQAVVRIISGTLLYSNLKKAT